TLPFDRHALAIDLITISARKEHEPLDAQVNPQQCLPSTSVNSQNEPQEGEDSPPRAAVVEVADTKLRNKEEWKTEEQPHRAFAGFEHRVLLEYFFDAPRIFRRLQWRRWRHIEGRFGRMEMRNIRLRRSIRLRQGRLKRPSRTRISCCVVETRLIPRFRHSSLVRGESCTGNRTRIKVGSRILLHYRRVVLGRPRGPPSLGLAVDSLSLTNHFIQIDVLRMIFRHRYRTFSHQTLGQQPGNAQA